MNRQEAIKIIEWAAMVLDIEHKHISSGVREALRVLQSGKSWTPTEVQRPTDEDASITGLVACGCGGKAEIGQYCEVTCDKCGASVPANYTEADAKAAWNRAMSGATP